MKKMNGNETRYMQLGVVFAGMGALGAAKGYCDGKGIPVEPQSLDMILTYAPTIGMGILGSGIGLGIVGAFNAAAPGGPKEKLSDLLKISAFGGTLGAITGAAMTATGYSVGYGISKMF